MSPEHKPHSEPPKSVQRMVGFYEGRIKELEEQLEAERRLADVFRRVLAQSHSLTGLELMIAGQTVSITEAEFDVVWEALDSIDDENYTLRAVSNPGAVERANEYERRINWTMADRGKWRGVYPGMCIDPETCRGKTHCPRNRSCCE